MHKNIWIFDDEGYKKLLPLVYLWQNFELKRNELIITKYGSGQVSGDKPKKKASSGLKDITRYFIKTQNILEKEDTYDD